MKGVKRSTAAEQAFEGSRTSKEVFEGPGFIPEPPPPHSPGFRIYMLALDMIFIPLATLMLRFCSRQLAKARSAKSRLRVVFLNPMLISLREVIKMSGI